MATSQVEGCKGARAAEERSRLYTLAPLSARSLTLPSFLFFQTFQVTADATLGVVVGVLVDKPSTSVCKTLVTAFRAANSFLKNFGFRALGLSGFLICYLSALAWVGERWTAGLFYIMALYWQNLILRAA